VKVHLESTEKIVELGIDVDGRTVFVPARVWEGVTAAGVPCHAYVTRIAVANGEDQTQFERELAEQRPPSPAIAALPSRMVL
jgi:hypothetical protein